MGAGIKAQFSDVFPYDEFGVITGTVGPTRFSNIGCGLARFKAFANNVGLFTFGNTSGTSSSMLPWQLAAGEETGWFATDNLNRFWYKVPSGTMDKLSYWIQR